MSDEFSKPPTICLVCAGVTWGRHGPEKIIERMEFGELCYEADLEGARERAREASGGFGITHVLFFEDVNTLAKLVLASTTQWRHEIKRTFPL